MTDINNIRSINNRMVKENDDCQKSISKLKQLENFLSNMGELSFGRDYIRCSDKTFSLRVVMTSLELTVGSIISCCENACIADANSLLRKYRDDMFFYLYVLVYDSYSKMDSNSKVCKDMESKINNWLKNELRDFYINQVLKAIAGSESLKDAVEKYNLKNTFDEIGEYLNNYVHSNGYRYYNQCINIYQSDKLAAELKELVSHAEYMTTVFLFLLVMCAPHLVMSEDFCDHLDFNETPPEDSQYWVAPFIDQFIKNNISLIDANCLNYLKANTVMQFDL